MNNDFVSSSPVFINDFGTPNKASGDGVYHYFQTTYHNTKTRGDLQSFALALFSFMPFVGWVGTIAGIILTARNMVAETLYVKVDHYYITGFSKYKYENYFYSDAKRTKLIARTAEYK